MDERIEKMKAAFEARVKSEPETPMRDVLILKGRLAGQEVTENV